MEKKKINPTQLLEFKIQPNQKFNPTNGEKKNQSYPTFRI